MFDFDNPAHNRIILLSCYRLKKAFFRFLSSRYVLRSKTHSDGLGFSFAYGVSRVNLDFTYEGSFVLRYKYLGENEFSGYLEISQASKPAEIFAKLLKVLPEKGFTKRPNLSISKRAEKAFKLKIA